MELGCILKEMVLRDVSGNDIGDGDAVCQLVSYLIAG